MKNKIQDLYTLGQLSFGHTVIHKLHPTVKLVASLVFIVTVVSFDRYAFGRIAPYIFYPTLLMALAEVRYSLLLKRFLIMSLLLAAVGVLDTANGTIEAGNVCLTKKTINEIRKQVGLVFQNPDDQLFMPLIYDDIAFGCRNFGMSESDVKMRVEETLARLNITHLQDRSSLKLSGGEKRMAAIATVLAMEPSVLLFDEPTAFLDPRARRTLTQTLNGLSHVKLIATHDMAFAAEVCERVIVLQNGSLAADGDISLMNDRKMMESFGF